MTAATLAKALENVSPELEIYTHGLKKVEGFEIVGVNKEQSEEWGVEQRFIILINEGECDYD